MIARLMLVVGGVAEVVSLCERASPGLPLVRARFKTTALEFARTMRPAVVLLSPDVPADDVHELHAAAATYGIPVIAIRSDAGDSDLGAEIRLALDGSAAAGAADGDVESSVLLSPDESSRER